MIAASNVTSYENRNGHAREAERHMEAVALRDRTAVLLEMERQRCADLERSAAAMQRLLAMLAHDLRSPLNAVLGWSDLLRRTPYDTETRKTGLMAIERSARMQAVLIDDLLDLTLMAEGKLRVEPSVCDAALIVRNVVSVFVPHAVQAGVDLVFVEPSAPLTVLADRRRTEQVVTNLITNALKFTQRGGRVEARVEGGPKWTRIVVADNGRGISASVLPHVFEWSTTEKRTAREVEHRWPSGLGLGLYIVDQLVRLQGGRIAAESPGEGLGATFTVSLRSADSLGKSRLRSARDRSREARPRDILSA